MTSKKEATTEQDVRSRYGDVVEAAAKARASGDVERADELMATAGRILADEQARAIAQTEQDNYARSQAASVPMDEE